MASFNNLQPASGPFLIWPGQSMDIIMWYGKFGDDKGAQWIMAHPIAGQPSTVLQVSNFRKILGYLIAEINAATGETAEFGMSKPYYNYGVTVTNLGQNAVYFNIQGGGNS